MRNKTIRWTPEENQIGRRLLEEDASEARFLETLGRTKKAAIGHFSYLEHRAMVMRRRDEMRITSAPNTVRMKETARDPVTPRSIVSELFGDPPPGRSALEGR